MHTSLDVIENIDTYISTFVAIYFQEYKMPEGLKYKIKIVDDMAKATEEFMKKTNRYFIVDESDYNGTTCVPNAITDEIEIYISKKIVENYRVNNWQFICTIFHELTHAVDFFNYCNKWFEGIFDSMINKSDPYGFHMWTEFNAKQKSYLLYSRFLRQCMKENNIPFGKPTDGELEFQNDFVTKSINDQSFDKAIYDIIQYLGRYYCWEIDFRDDFIDEKLFPNIFKQKLEPEINVLYKKLKESKDSIAYYNELAKLIRLLIGKIIMIQN
ncbi:MAG: hypothetical protein J6G98_03290 [Bacilli bacterium]|nr:hypothetical protein [Bacilli bacterium]